MMKYMYMYMLGLQVKAILFIVANSLMLMSYCR